MRRLHILTVALALMGLSLTLTPPGAAAGPPLGLPEVPVPADNPQTPQKIALGEKLYHDTRFSATGAVGCVTCHDPQMAFADRKTVAEGVEGKKGTRNSPTVINAAYYETQFWDGRVPSLEEQAKQPLTNPVEHGLESFAPILETIRNDPDYPKQFEQVFGVKPAAITIDHVVKAIASFERTVVAGDSPFDRYEYGGDQSAMSEAAIRGLALYRGKARCQDCHTIGQTSATFTDNDFHNLGVAFKNIEDRMMEVANKFRQAKMEGKSVDETVLTDRDMSELGRFAVTLRPSDIGRFKTVTLRNIAVTAPYMHDGSQKTLLEVIEFYDKGGEDNPFLDGGIRPLNLTEQEKKDLVEFLEHLTSPQFAQTPQPKE